MNDEKFKEKVKKYMKENASLLKRHHLTCRPVLSFKKNPTFMTRFGMWLLSRRGVVLDTEFKSTK